MSTKDMIGKTISHYRVLETIGAGGMGVVYKARDVNLNRDVALKFLPQNPGMDVDAKNRFINEAQSASAIDHPNICSIYDIDETDDGRLFIAMAYYEGETLRKKIESGSLLKSAHPIEECIEIAMQIAGGLAKAHEKGIIHRDIKPENIIITTDGIVKILDFGLAKLAGNTMYTKENTTLGTINYMSPEQTKGMSVDHRTDIWALGVIMYEMLTGEPPFKGEYEQAVIYSILNEKPDPPSKYNSKISKNLEKVIRFCLEKDPAARWSSSADLLHSLQNIMEGKKPVRLSSQIYKISRPYKEKLTAGKFLLPVIALIIILLIFIFPQSRNAIFDIFNGEKQEITAAVPAGPVIDKRIAILNFVTDDSTPEEEYFAAGLHSIITEKLPYLMQFDNTFRLSNEDSLKNYTLSDAYELIKNYPYINRILNCKIHVSNNKVQCIFTLQKYRGDSLTDVDNRVMDGPIANLQTWQDSVIITTAKFLGIKVDTKGRKLISSGNTSVPEAFLDYLQSIYYAREKDHKKSIELLKNAVSLDPSYAAAYSKLSRVLYFLYWKSGNIKEKREAFEYCMRALDLDSNFMPALSNLPLYNYLDSNKTETLIYIDKILKTDSQNFDAHLYNYKFYNKWGSKKEYENSLKKSISHFPFNAKLINELGVFYQENGKLDLALSTFQKALELSPEDLDILNNIGVVYIYQKKYHEAEKVFKLYLNIKQSYIPYSQLGVVYYNQLKYADAAEMFKKATEFPEATYQIWGNLADSYYWIPGKKELARPNYLIAADSAELKLKKNPDDPDILSCLARYYLRLGEPEKGLELIEKASGNKELSFEQLFIIADFYENYGNREKALEWIKKAIRAGYPLEMIYKNPGLKGLVADSRFNGIISDRK